MEPARKVLAAGAMVDRMFRFETGTVQAAGFAEDSVDGTRSVEPLRSCRGIRCTICARAP